jgi:predicted nuclease with TOPRIM domain
MTSSRIEHLKGRIDALQQEQDALWEELAAAQTDDWEARFQDLNVQLHLGVMEMRERLTPILDALTERVHGVRAYLASPEDTTVAEITETLREGFAKALRDINDAAQNARAVLVNRDN